MSKVPSDREIIEVLARDVMEFPSERVRWAIRYAVPGGFLYFYDDDSPYINKHEGWNPLASWADAGMLIEKLSVHYAFAIWSTPMHSSFLKDWLVAFKRRLRPLEYRDLVGACIGQDEKPCRAISLAAYALAFELKSAGGA